MSSGRAGTGFMEEGNGVKGTGFRFTLQEFSGSLADLGVMVPLVILLIVKNGIILFEYFERLHGTMSITAETTVTWTNNGAAVSGVVQLQRWDALFLQNAP